MGMIDPKTWGWIKVLGGLVAFWFAWKAGITMYSLGGAVAILAALVIIGGLNLAMSKK